MSNKVTYKNYNMNQLQIPMDITDGYYGKGRKKE